MTRADVFAMISSHLATELRIDPARIIDEASFKDDLEADSLHLVELVMELEDSYGIRISDEDARQLTTVGAAVDYVVAQLAGQ